MIVFGDCVGQFEHMVDRKSKMYQSQQGLKKEYNFKEQQFETLIKGDSQLELEDSLRGSIKYQDSDVPTKTPNPKQIREDRQKNPFIESVVLKESDKGITQTTLANKLDSPITIHLTVEQSLARALEAGPATRVNKDLDKELPKFKRMSEVDLVPIKSGYSSVKDPKQLQHNSLLLISQKVKLASPAPRRNR